MAKKSDTGKAGLAVVAAVAFVGAVLFAAEKTLNYLFRDVDLDEDDDLDDEDLDEDDEDEDEEDEDDDGEDE